MAENAFSSRGLSGAGGCNGEQDQEREEGSVVEEDDIEEVIDTKPGCRKDRSEGETILSFSFPSKERGSEGFEEGEEEGKGEEPSDDSCFRGHIQVEVVR